MSNPTENESSRPKLSVIERPIGDLKFAEYNPRFLTEKQFERIKESLTRFGFVDPLIVNTHPKRVNIVVGGNMRLRVAIAMGYKTVPCVAVNLTLERERELNVRLNKNVGEWDYDVLANQFEIADLKAWGFEDWELPGVPFNEDEKVLNPDNITDIKEQNPNFVKCPNCGNEFVPVKKIDKSSGKRAYAQSMADDAKP